MFKKCELSIISTTIYSSFEEVKKEADGLLKNLENLENILKLDMETENFSGSNLSFKDLSFKEKQKIFLKIMYVMYLNLDISIKIICFNRSNIEIIKRYREIKESDDRKKLIEENGRNIISNIEVLENIEKEINKKKKVIKDKLLEIFSIDELKDILKYIESCNKQKISIEKEVKEGIDEETKQNIYCSFFNFDFKDRFIKDNFNIYIEKEVKIYIKRQEKKLKKEAEEKEKEKEKEKSENKKIYVRSMSDNLNLELKVQKEKRNLTDVLNNIIKEYKKECIEGSEESKVFFEENVKKNNLEKEYNLFLEIKKINMLFDEYFKKYLIALVKVYSAEKRKFKIESLEEYLEKNNMTEIYKYFKSTFNENREVVDFLEKNKEDMYKKIYEIYSPFLKNSVTLEDFKNMFAHFDIYKVYGMHLSKKIIETEEKEKEKLTNKEDNSEDNKIYLISPLKEDDLKNYLEGLEILGEEYLKKVKKYIEKENIYCTQNARFRSFFVPDTKKILLSHLNKKIFIHELGHAIHGSYIIEDIFKKKEKNEMLVELYSQVNEYIIFKKNLNNILQSINNKSYDKEKYDGKEIIAIYQNFHRYIEIKENIKVLEIKNKISKYLNEIFKDIKIDNLKTEDEEKIIEENIDKLIDNLDKEERRDLFFTAKYNMSIFEEIKYDFPLYLIPTIYNKIVKENSYTEKYIESMKLFNIKNLDELLEILNVHPKELNEELARNYKEILEKCVKFLLYI